MDFSWGIETVAIDSLYSVPNNINKLKTMKTWLLTLPHLPDYLPSLAYPTTQNPSSTWLLTLPSLIQRLLTLPRLIQRLLTLPLPTVYLPSTYPLLTLYLPSTYPLFALYLPSTYPLLTLPRLVRRRACDRRKLSAECNHPRPVLVCGNIWKELLV